MEDLWQPATFQQTVGRDRMTSIPPPVVPWALFLDVDGTLLELAEHPDAVIIPAELIPLLKRLKWALHGAVALISGRTLASLNRILGDAGLDAAGCHGAELAFSGTLEFPASSTASLLAGIVARLTHNSAHIPLVMIEPKAYSVAFHYRPPTLDADQANSLVWQALGDDGEPFRLIRGKQVVEVIPKTAGKAQAIARFLEQVPYAGRLPVFVGDDTTDEEGFSEVNRRNGISICVGAKRETAAIYRLDSVADVLTWLAGPVCQHVQA